MPFIRYTRDRRGYETTFVMHGYRSPQGAPQNRVLYLFRSPSNLGVGRRPLDEEVVEALEHTHPDLTFDWPALLRGHAETRVEARTRFGRPPVAGAAARRRERTAKPASEPPAGPMPVDDQSLLGRVAGARAAAGLRERYAALLERILRRARTPEERDRLTERGRRLNPDDWADEAAVVAGLASVAGEFDAILAELPQRRRGRRGGRRRDRQPAEASAIMEPVGEHHASENEVAEPDGAAGAHRDTGGDRGEPDAPGPAAGDVRRQG